VPSNHFYPHHQIGLRRFDHHVKTVLHQAKSMRSPIGLLADLRQSYQELVPIRIVREDRLAAIPAVHEVVNRPRVLDAQLPSHPAKIIACVAQSSTIFQYH
jgi:hypothetical protein